MPPIKTLESVNKRRLAPMLTITLPSTEELCVGVNIPNEDSVSVSPPPPPPPLPPPPTLPVESLKNRVSSKPPLSPHPEEKLLKAAVQPKNKLHEDISPTQQKDPYKRQNSGGSAGTSPPTPRRPSKWSKVKNAFLTSGAGNEECLQRGSNSVPSSPVKSSNFIYDLESDELSSGEFIDDNQKDNDDVFQEPTDEVCDFGRNENIHAEIQRNFEELQLKLSHEFHKKLCEWERIKNSGVGTPPSGTRVGGSGVSSGTSSVGEETPHDKSFRRKMEEWERMKSASASCSKHRESVALHQLGEENLSADFKKKLEQWEKIKSVPVLQTPDTLGSGQLQFKKKITEWQKRRHGGSTKNDVQVISPSSELPEDFYRKLQEWERLKQPNITGTTSENDNPGNKTPSPGSGRRDFTDHKKKSQNSPTGLKEKWSDSSGGQFKVHKNKHQEVKELAWLEKELHKIEREKQRLERERDKYLEREARLEKMRRAIGSGMKKQEVLIPTSTGLFRFQGISQKFTRKLYEWEKARGIGPEESTFALLDPGYQPPVTSGMASKVSGDPNMNNGVLLTRSKSVGSVADLAVTGNQSNLTHQPSSLSLNNMEQLESTQLDSVLQGSDEGDLCSHHDHLDDEEPEAMIVDIEDVIEETAAPLIEIPAVETQTPVYCYAPEEVTRLIDSSGSDSEKDQVRQKTVSVANEEAVHSSYQLLQENITLLNKLKKKGDICRQLEYKMEDLEGKLNVAAKIHKEELGNLAEAEDKPFALENDGDLKADSTYLEQIKARLHELECHQELLLKEGETLQYSFAENSEQQAVLAQHLVGKVKQLQEANINISNGGELKEQETDSLDNYSDSKQEDTLAAVQDLTSQLLNMAEKLEIAIGERNQEILQLRKALDSRGRSAVTRNLRLSQHWFSTDSMSSVGVTDYDISQLGRQSSEELAQLPSLLTNKVLELKRGLSYLCAASDMSTKIPQEVTSPGEITPDSSEADTTFTIKCGKSPNPSSTHLVGEEDIMYKNCSRYMESSQPGSPVITTYTFTPAFMKRNPDNVSSTKKETEMKSYESEELCKCNRPPIDILCTEEHKSSAFSFNGPVLEDVGTDVHIRRKSIDVQNASFSLNDDMVKESTNKKVRKQKRESGERFGNFDKWRSKQNYQLDADDDDDDDDDDIDGDDIDDTDCDKVENNQFETNISKKITSKSAKSKKLLKTRRITDTHVTYDRNNEEASNEITLTNAETDEMHARSCENRLEDTNSDEDKSSSSPKIVTRRLKKFVRKNSKDESNKCSVEIVNTSTNNFSTNYFNNNIDSNERTSTIMNVNVFVPTTRRIFSPVRRDSKGKASSVIGYIVDEPELASVINQNVDIFSRNIDSYQQNMTTIETDNRLCNQLESECKRDNTENDNKEKSKEPTFIPPPCWILKQTRAQSASPALQRRLFTYSRSREKEECNKEEKESVVIRKWSTTDQQSELSTSPQIESSANTGENMTSCLVNSHIGKEMNANENENQYSPDSSGTKDDNNNKNNNLNFESSVDNVKQIRKDTIGLPNLKFRIEAGFPPISPISVRKEVKSPQKETAPSIRMMIARYNQKVTESQEAMGSKSPESGSASPIAWCSPATKRRVKAQMERYQEEVQCHLQNWVRRDFTGKVEVKKSASAGYIRAPDKEDSLNDLSSKASSEETGCRQMKLGILKSSSAGVIKTTSPLPLRAEKSNKVQTNDQSSVNSDKVLSSVAYDSQSNQFSDSKTNNFSDTLFVHDAGAWALAKDDSGSSVFSQSSPQASRARALKIKKAKEEFLSRGPGGESWSSECGGGISDIDSSKCETSIGIKFNETGNRLSQVSCESESSYDGRGPMVACSDKERTSADDEDVILIKSASAGMINVDSSMCSRIFNDQQQNVQQPPSNEQGVIPKSRFGIFSRFRRAKMRRHKEKSLKLDTVSTLCRQSLVVDIQRKRSQEEKEPVASTSKSCPSSPVLQKRDPQSSSWIRNPKKIFKPK